MNESGQKYGGMMQIGKIVIIFVCGMILGWVIVTARVGTPADEGLVGVIQICPDESRGEPAELFVWRPIVWMDI